MNLDWFSVGILATGLPLALRNVGPWLGTNAVFLLGIFVLPRNLSAARARAVKLLAIVLGAGVFLYANYGAMGLLPPPSTTLGPVATLTLRADTTEWLLRVVDGVLFGPVLVGTFATLSNRVLTRSELADIPLVTLCPGAIPTRSS